MKAHINVSLEQQIQKTTKTRNTPTFSTYIVMQIMLEIYLTDDQSHQQIIHSMVPSLTSVTINNLRPLELVPMQKQEQCTQWHQIKIRSETSIDQLVTPQSLYQNCIIITKQQLNESWQTESLHKPDLSKSWSLLSVNFIFKKTFEMVDTISNMKLADLNSNPHGRKFLRDLIDISFGVRLYPTPGSQHYKLFRLETFNGTIKINDNHKKKNEIKTASFV